MLFVLDRRGLLPQPLPFCSIRVQYSAPPGSAIAEISSIEQKGDLVIDSRVTNEADWLGMSGAHPWHLDDETESVLILTNMGDRECRMGFQVQAGGVHYYLIDLKLAAHEIRAIDIRKLRDAQKPDFQGNVIPAAASDGSVVWARMEDVPVTGRLVVLQRHKAIASNYTCGTGCPYPTNFTLLTVTCTGHPILVAGTDQHFSTETRRDCNQLAFYYDVTNSSSWTSSLPAIATVNNSTHKGLATGVSGGTTSIVAQFSTTNYYYIPYRGCQSQPVNGGDGLECPVVTVEIKTQDNSRPFVFVGTNDQFVTQYNTQLAVGLPNGGKYLWSVTPQAVTINPNNSTSAYYPTITGNTPSTSVGGTTESVQYTYPVTNGQTDTDSRAITLRKFSALTTPSTVSGCPDWPGAPDPGLGYLKEFKYNILTSPGSQQVESGFGDMTVSESLSVTSVSPPGTQVTLYYNPSTGTFDDSRVYDCLGLPSSTALPPNVVVCATQTISVGGIPVRTNTLKYTNTTVSIVGTCQ